MTSSTWKDIAKEKRAKRAACIPAEWMLPAEITNTVTAESQQSVLEVPKSCGILSAKEIEITSKYDAVDLLAKMAAKELTSSEVTLAFCKRASIAQQLVNCLTEMFFDMAMERAKWLDEQLERSGPVGPLHGLPISLKDCFKIKGIDTVSGYVSYLFDGPAKSNSALVDLLLEQGAVLYVKTNCPQTMMVAETDNNVFGRTLNPNKPCLGAGGSSGGEGALSAMRGSILGFGTDIGGSIRIPALCNGTFGFRPTTNRVPYGGQADFVREGYPPDITCVAGPLAHSARDIHMIMKTVIKAKPWENDFTATPIPWNDAVEVKDKLTIGFIAEDPSSPVAPPVLRTMKTARKLLEEAGHNVVELNDIPSFQDAVDLAWRYFDLDNEQRAFYKFTADSGEPLINAVIEMYHPNQPKEKLRSLDDLFEMNIERKSFKQKWHQVFRDNKLDVLLMPGNRNTAMEHDEYKYPAYTTMWNLVDYPACMIPFGKVDKAIDLADSKTPFYKPDLTDGAPCSVQVVATIGQDERLAAAVEVISTTLLGQM